MIDSLKQKQKSLIRMLSEAEERMKKNENTSGRVEIERRGEKVIYYKCTGSDKGGLRTKQYIRQADIEEAKLLAQAAYDKKAIPILRDQINALNAFLGRWDENRLKMLYGQMKDERKELIDPMEVDDKTYAARWQSMQYQPGEFMPGFPEIYTNKGERVRSKSEKIIADELLRLNIPYHYEYPLIIDGKTVRPDFYVLNVRNRRTYYMELLGMMDDPDYARKNVWKINQYAKQGYVQGKNLLLLYETSDQPLDMKAVRALIKTYLK